MAKSLQDILKRRQQEEFVGREEQLSFFHRNLRWEIDDPRRRFIINISGQGGVGKTWLLRRFRKIAEEFAAVTGYTDETEEDIPSVMGRLAEQCEAQEHPLKTFAERYKVYRQRRQEIEADPDIPQGFPAFLGRTLAKGGLRLARWVPVGGVVADFIDEDALAGQAGDFASYVARKIGNKDDVQLVLEPMEVLTPLFLADLQQVAEKHPVALFFDTYERTGDFLDPWLRDLLEGRYGDVPANILFVIAGRDAMDRNLWAPYEGLLARLLLDPFTEDEVREYLTHKVVTDQQVVEVILRLSGRLPLLVATLAAESPDDPSKVGDPSGEAIERFLKWVENPRQRQVALNAALPRRLNRDVLAALVGKEDADALFAWLREMPFVEKRGDGWAYHDVVREQMLHYKHQESPHGWADLHGRLAEYYEKLWDGPELEEKIGCKDETWQGYVLEALYHRLCQSRRVQLATALNGFVAALEAQFSFSLRWAGVVRDAGKDAGVPSVQKWGRQLEEGVKAYAQYRYQEASEMFTACLQRTDIQPRWQTVALVIRGLTYFWMERFDDALADFDRVLELDPDLHEAYLYQGITYRGMRRYEEAFKEFKSALEHGVDEGWVLANRGVAYQMMERYEDALTDFDRAVELRPDIVWALASRGQTYMRMKHYEEALFDLNQALQLDPNMTSAIVRRGITYREMGRYEEAFKEFNSALEHGVDEGWVLANRGVAYQMMERYEDALTDFDRAVTLRPDIVWALASRGQTYMRMEHYEEALADLNQALQLDPNMTSAIIYRGIAYRQMERYSEALDDFGRVLESELNLAWALANRGVTYRLMGCYEKALADLSRALELNFNHAWAIASRGITYQQMGCYEKALADLNRAIEMQPDDDWILYHRALVYKVLGQIARAQADLTAIIQRARNTYEKEPRDWRNTLVLALYHIAAGEDQEARRLYQEAFFGGVSPHRIRRALRAVDDFLALFPHHSQAQAMRDLLQQHLQEAEA
jgi:tetratricopeptide (TPR) repeat protein